MRHKEALAGYLFSSPYLAGFLIFFAIPSQWACIIVLPEEWAALSLQGWIISKALLQATRIALRWKTHLYSIPSVCRLSWLSHFAGNAFKQSSEGSKVFSDVFRTASGNTVASIILVWQITFNEFGVLNNLLNHFGIAGVEWLNSKWSIAVLVLLYVWKNCGYNIILFTAGLNSIPKDYYDAASIDGAGGFKCLQV